MFLSELLARIGKNAGDNFRRRRNSKWGLASAEHLEARQLLTFDLRSVMYAPHAADLVNSSTTVSSFVVSFTKSQNETTLGTTLGATVTKSPYLENGYVVKYSSNVNVLVKAEQLSKLADFEYLHPELVLTPTAFAVPNDPLFADQWHLQNTGQGNGLAGVDANVVSVWDQYTGKGVTVLIADDAIELTHEDLAPNAGPPSLHYDYVSGDNDPSPTTAGQNHGTSVSGVAVGRGNNGIGVSGSAPNAELAGVRIIGPVTDSQLAGSASHQNQIVDASNNSWGYTFFLSTLGPQEAAAYRNGVTQGRGGLGVIYLFAAGNSRGTEDNVNYHGQQGSRYTITVGAIANTGQISSYSTPGAKILVSAPSNGGTLGITTTDRSGDNGYNAQGNNDGDAQANTNYTSTFGGTSSATPLVTGVVALILEANPNLTWREVQDILVQTATKVNPSDASWFNNGAGHHFSHDYGFGMVNAQAAVNLAKTYVKMRPEVTANRTKVTLNQAIPDNSSTRSTQTLNFTESLKVTHAELRVNISHARRGDLEVSLLSPSGTRTILAESRTLDAGADYANWTFTSVGYWDEMAAGNWTVEVRDLRNGTTGTLNSVSLTLYGTDPDIPVPSKPVILGPTGTIAIGSPQYQWAAATNASTYELEVTNAAGTVVLSKKGITTTTFDQPTQLSEGTYTFRVRAVNSENEIGPWSDVATFTFDIPTPATPSLLRPQGDIGDSFPVFEWTDSLNASNYNLWVSRVSTGERVIYKTGHAELTYTHFSALKDGAYRAWVQAVNTVGERSAWSKAVDFVIDAPVPAAPKLTAPAAVTTSPNPRVTWEKMTGVSSYDIWFNNLSTGEIQYLRKTDLPRDKNFYDPPAFPQGNYVVWLRAANGNGEYGPWSSARYFSVDVLPPTVPVATGPKGATKDSTLITTVNPTFSWNAAARAVKYELWANNMTTGQYQIIRLANIEGTTYTPVKNLTQGEYRYWVRGINSAGEVGEWSNVYTFTIDEPTPLVPQIIEPTANPAGSVENPNPTFKWTSTTKAPYYELQVTNVSLGSVNVITATNLTTESYTVPTAKRLGEYTYSARVRAFNSSGDTSDWSPVFSFRIDVPDPTTPRFIGPRDTTNDTTPTFSWTHDKTGFRYEILVRDMVRGENIVLQVVTFQVNPTQTEAYYTLPDAKALRASTYRFWIRSFNSLGQSSGWSAAQSFVIAANENASLKLLSDESANAASPEMMLTSLPVQSESAAPVQVQQVQPAEEVIVPVEHVPVAPERVQPMNVPMASEQELAMIDEALQMMADPAAPSRS